MNNENKNAESINTEDELKGTIEETLSKLRRQSMLLGG